MPLGIGTGGHVDERARLMELLARMQRLSDEHWHLLDQPCRAMEDKAWVGPSGRSFDGRIHGSLGTLRAELKEAIALSGAVPSAELQLCLDMHTVQLSHVRQREKLRHFPVAGRRRTDYRLA
jgi:hypothetical protein